MHNQVESLVSGEDFLEKCAMQTTTPVITSLPTYTELLQKGWDYMKNDLPLTAGLTLVYCLGLGAVGYIEYYGWVISIFISAGYVACLLQMRQGKTFEFKDFLWAFQSFERVIHVLLGSVLRSFLIGIGLVLLVVPGIYWSVTTSLTDILIVKEKLDAITAMKRSMSMVKGRWWYMAGLLGVIMFLNIVGFLCFLVGVLVTIPLSFHILLNVSDEFAATTASVIPVNPT